jgi:hypothetical protein
MFPFSTFFHFNFRFTNLRNYVVTLCVFLNKQTFYQFIQLNVKVNLFENIHVHNLNTFLTSIGSYSTN